MVSDKKTPLQVERLAGITVTPTEVGEEYRDAKLAMTLYWRTLARARGVEAHSRDGMAWVTSRSECGPARIYHLDLPADAASQRLSAVKSSIIRGDLPNGILFTPADGPENLLSLLSAGGFAVNLAVPCMMIQLGGSETAVPQPASVTVDTVKTRQALAAWADIVATDLYGMQVLDIAQLDDLLSLPDVRFYLAQHDGTPAAACLTIRDGALGALEMVATRAALRRRGIGAAMVRQAMADLRDAGVRSLHLRAESDAIPFYDALGFRALGPRILAKLPEAGA